MSKIKELMNWQDKWSWIMHKLAIVFSLAIVCVSFFGYIKWYYALIIAVFTFLAVFNGGKKIIDLIVRRQARNQGAAAAEDIFRRPDMTEMLAEVADLMGSKEYLEMSDIERKNAVALVRRKHGFSDTF